MKKIKFKMSRYVIRGKSYLVFGMIFVLCTLPWKGGNESSLYGSISNVAYAKAPKSKKNIKSLSLFVGVYHDEKIPLAPRNFTSSGTYKKSLKVEYEAKKRVLRFYPKKVGQVTLAIKHPVSGKILYEYRVDVKKTDLYKVGREIKHLLREIDGISVKILDNKVVVDGQILLPRDMNRIHSVVVSYGARAISLVTLSPVARVKIGQFIERAINNPEIHVRSINGKFILEGLANDRDEKDRAEIIAKTYVPAVVVDQAVADKKIMERKVNTVINLIRIRPSPESSPKKIVQLVAHYVELQKDYLRSFRIQWTPDLGDGSQVEFSTGGDGVGGVVSTITGTIRNLLPKLNWAKEHGHARVLQSTSIIVQDGEQGSVNSITRVPYQIVNQEGQPSTNFEEAGIRMTITPNILGARSDSIRMSLNFAVKSLVSISEQGPLTTSREMKTVLVVQSGRSAAVGGLISNESNTNYNKLPANASRNPIISLYASKDFRRNQSQFIVFISPRIKVSASEGAERIKRKFRMKR